MQVPGKADPSIYPKLRELALASLRRDAALPDFVPHVVLMDWCITNGTLTAMAAADGSASLYLSSGGGFIGGGQSNPAIREAALHAIAVAARLLPLAKATQDHGLPMPGEVRFFFVTGQGVFLATALEDNLKANTDPLGSLGGAMQNIVTQYRMSQQRQSSPN